MKRVLFVSNGHGEAAIANRIAYDVRALLPSAHIDHFPLVGDTRLAHAHEVGPRCAMPSGGLVAMGNLRNLLLDLRAGLLGSIARQRRFLRHARARYNAVVAVGDAYALAMALRAGAPTIFVGTAKSVYVAPYGRFERRLLSRAATRFVRDEPTAAHLLAHDVVAEAANVIVDLFTADRDARLAEVTRGFTPSIALLPGSRTGAYADATFLLSVVRGLLPRYPSLGAILSVAEGLDGRRFAADARREGWAVNESTGSVPFTLSLDSRLAVVAWSGALGPVFARATLVMGQAGTANEGAAAQGVPVVAFSAERWGASRWYRRRQQGLLGDALTVVSGKPADAIAAVAELLDDGGRRAHMGECGRARMGAPGAAARIAAAVTAIVEERQCAV